MTHSTYIDTIALAIRALEQTRHLLALAHKQVEETDIAESTILTAKLAPDMFDFTRQIQMVSDNAKGIYARLAGVEAPSMPDTESSLVELMARIDATRNFIDDGLIRDDDAINTTEITFPWMPGKKIMAHDYIVDFAIPNIFFHMSMAYAILRSNGVPVGKMDFLGAVNFIDV
jgi:uncharacterized protein